MNVYTTTRDADPSAMFAGRLPDGAVYVRLIIAAPNLAAAEQELERLHLARRYAETLHTPTSRDAPAALVGEREFNTATPALYLLYRIDPTVEGTTFRKPRFYLAQLTDTGDVQTIGRIRVVGMGQPTNPFPQVALTEDEADDDPVMMPAEREGGLYGAAMGDLMPAGALGYLTTHREGRLDFGIADVQGELELIAARIQRSRLSSDKRVAWGRESSRLLDLSRHLAELAADAAAVELVLQAGQ
jgi:hypothetical protein